MYMYMFVSYIYIYTVFIYIYIHTSTGFHKFAFLIHPQIIGIHRFSLDPRSPSRIKEFGRT